MIITTLQKQHLYGDTYKVCGGNPVCEGWDTQAINNSSGEG